MKEYYKTLSGKIVELEDLTQQKLWGRDITELILNENCQNVWCWDNQLTELILDENCQLVLCHNNQLKSFDTNKAQWVECDMKSLTNLNKVDRLYLWI